MCAQRAQEARNIEAAHQGGVPIEDALAHYDHAMVLLSYQDAPYYNEGFQREQIERFTTARVIECYRANGQ